MRDDVYELRVGLRGVNYRMFYFFHSKSAAVLSHGLLKERQVPATEIDRAIQRKKQFETAPDQHTFLAEI